MRAAVLVIAIATACSHPNPGTLRFVNKEPAWRVADRAPIPKPAEREYLRLGYTADSFFIRRATRAMDARDPQRALDINSVDEVPDSTWFTNRIGIRDISIPELRRGANLGTSPLEHLPWTITGAKVGGMAIGFVFEDARGDKYLLKFDMAEVPEMETGAHVMGHRFVWAAGWNVPEDYLGVVARTDLRVAPDAKKKDPLGGKAPLTQKDLDDALAKVSRTPDGRIRVLASRYVKGVPLGGYAREGTREDDPNDQIAHENRRSLRGQVAFFSWLNHSDLQEDNTLDAFVPHGDKKGPGHVVHYLIDFGKAFGVMNNSNNWKTVGYTHRLDMGMGLRTLFTLGLWNRPWDQTNPPKYPGLAYFEAEHFDPSWWRTNSPYWPFFDADRVDGFWGAKLVMRFTREQIAAVVDEAQYSDPRTRAYLVETLLERQRRVGAYWFRQVSPLDRFTIASAKTGHTVCFDDLAITYGLESGVNGTYVIATYDAKGTQTARLVTAARPQTCFPLTVDSANDGYTIVQLAVRRGGTELPSLRVHFARDEAGTLRIIGLRRQ